MDYDELIYMLYQTARESSDEEFQSRMFDLGWSVKKNGIREEGDDPEDEIYFGDLIRGLEIAADQAKDKSDRIKVEEMKNDLITKGIDGYVRQFWNY